MAESTKKRVSVDFDLNIDTDRQMYDFLVKMGGKTSAVKFSISLLMNSFYRNLNNEVLNDNTINEELESNMENKMEKRKKKPHEQFFK